MADADEPFIWGQGGTKDSLSARRKVALALMAKGSDYSPVAHWTQGLARVADAMVGAWQNKQLDDLEKTGLTEQAGRNAILAGADPTSLAASVPMAGGAAPTSTAAAPNVTPEIKDGIVQTAAALGADPVDLATAISYETGGTFDPTKAGPRTKWGQHRGLIQFGEPQARDHGVDWNNPVSSQLGPNGAIVSYMKASGYKPGMPFLDLYSTINAGAPGLYDRSDAKAGGAPGSVRDKVEQQMQGHRAKAQALFRAAQADMPTEGAMPVEAATGQPGFVIPEGQRPVESVPGDDPAQLRADAQRYAQSNPEAARQLLARADAADAAAVPAMLPPPRPANLALTQASAPSMTAQTFDAVQNRQPGNPAFQAQGAFQPWMGSALANPGITQVARALSAATPPARPAGLALANPQADMPAPGAAPAMGQLPAEAQLQPDLSNENGAGMRQLQVASEDARQGQPSGAIATSPVERIVQALTGSGQASTAPAASPAVQRLATALQGSWQAQPASATASPAAVNVAGALAAPTAPQPTTARLQAAYATLNSPYARPGERALAQGIIQQSLKGAEFETLTRPDGSVYRVPKAGGAPVLVFGPQSKPEGPTGDMREYDLHVAQEKAAGRQPESFTEWARGNKASGRTSINIDTKGAGKFAEKANELQAKRYGEMVEGSDGARTMQGDLDMLEGMSKGISTGRGAETRLAMAQFAKAWGFDDIASGLTGGKLPEMEAFTSLIDKLTPQMRQGMPGAASDRDVSIFRNALPSMLKTPEGNQIVMQTLRAMNDYKMRAGDLAGQALRGEISQADADKGIRGMELPFAKFKEYRATQDKAGAQGGASAAPAASAPPPEARKSVGGKSYVKRGTEWFEE
jgi:hypothetical protein